MMMVMIIRNYHWLNSASRVLISTCSAPLAQTGEQFFFVWPWPTIPGQPRSRSTLTPKIKVKGQMVLTGECPQQTDTHAQMDGHTHGCYQTYHLPCYAVDNKLFLCVRQSPLCERFSSSTVHSMVHWSFDCHKLVLYWNGWTVRADLWHRGKKVAWKHTGSMVGVRVEGNLLKYQLHRAAFYLLLITLLTFNAFNAKLYWLGPFYAAIAVPSVTRCRYRGHRCAGGVWQYR